MPLKKIAVESFQLVVLFFGGPFLLRGRRVLVSVVTVTRFLRVMSRVRGFPRILRLVSITEHALTRAWIFLVHGLLHELVNIYVDKVIFQYSPLPLVLVGLTNAFGDIGISCTAPVAKVV